MSLTANKVFDIPLARQIRVKVKGGTATFTQFLDETCLFGNNSSCRRFTYSFFDNTYELLYWTCSMFFFVGTQLLTTFLVKF
jgi:hypothetical protein